MLGLFLLPQNGIILKNADKAFAQEETPKAQQEETPSVKETPSNPPEGEEIQDPSGRRGVHRPLPRFPEKPPQEQIEIDTEEIKKDPNDVLAYVSRAEEKEKLGDISGAIEDLKTAYKVLNSKEVRELYLYEPEFPWQIKYDILRLRAKEAGVEVEDLDEEDSNPSQPNYSKPNYPQPNYPKPNYPNNNENEDQGKALKEGQQKEQPSLTRIDAKKDLLISQVVPSLPVRPSAEPKLDALQQKFNISRDELLLLFNNNGSWYIDNGNDGNINVLIARPDGNSKSLVRLTLNPERTAIISAGLIQTKDVDRYIRNGRFTPTFQYSEPV